MSLRVLYSVGVLTLVTIFTACSLIHSKTNSQAQEAKNTPKLTATPHADGARRITTQELETLMKEGKAFVVDVRTQESYDAGHIPGAKLIPSANILNHLKELPRDKIIVTYCS